LSNTLHNNIRDGVKIGCSSEEGGELKRDKEVDKYNK
jgi:hypothetical protein